MPFDALTYAWNHPERLGPALSGRFAADALGPWTRLDGSFDQLAEAVRPMTAAIVCGLRADALVADCCAIGRTTSVLLIRPGSPNKKAPLTRGLFCIWCPGAESNHRHEDFQSSALPTELPGPC